MLAEFTARRRTTASLARVTFLPSVAELKEQDIKEEAYLSNYEQRVAAAREKSLGGRTSGTLDWRAQRQEVGLDTDKDEVVPRKISE
jgi:hypothetical protein